MVLMLATSLLLSAAPASAATELGWNEFKLPSSATTSNVILNADALTDEAVDFAIANDGTTVYAVDGANVWVYKSTDAGKTWSRKTPANLVTAASPPYLVAVAPDDPDLVTIVLVNDDVFASVDGLSKISDLSIGAADCQNIIAIAISPETSGKHHIAVGGNDGAGGVANAIAVASYNLGATVPSWTVLDTKATMDGTDTVHALAFSPGFASDFTMAAITSTDLAPGAVTDLVYLELYSFASGNEKWNDDAGTWSDYTGTGHVIASDTGGLTAPLVAADISLAPDYYGGDEAMRIAFVGLDTGVAANDGVYRMTDESKKSIKTEDIYSVAFDGTNLIAGESGSNSVFRSSDPLASSPTFSSTSTYQRPNGESGAVKVRWSGADVVAISQGDEGAYSVSHDNGKSFNDISLIDTVLTSLEDIAVSADGSVVWAISLDAGTDVSVWRNASDWERVLKYTAAVNLIVRLAPDDADNVYLGASGGTTMFYSSDGGEAKWHLRNCGVTLTDLAVEDADVVYAINTGGSVSKSTNNGFTWGDSKSTGIGTGVTITSMGEDNLLVTGTASKVGWSTDGNSSWSKTSKIVTSAGKVQAVASGLSDGDFIYAATAPAPIATATTATLVERWEIGSSTSWKDMSAPTTADLDADATDETYGAYGIGLSNGTLYVLLEDNTTGSADSALIRTLDGTGDTFNWSTVSALTKTHDGEPVNSVGGNALKLSAGSVNVWAVDSTTELFYYYIDAATETGPTLLGPGDGADVMVNPVSGGTYTISFTWERLSKATKYNLVIALGSDFEEVVVNYAGTTAPAVISDTGSIAAQVVAGTVFMPETTYYWRVRLASDGPVYSPWSEVRSFTIGELPEAVAPVIIEQPPAPVIQVPPAPAITITPPEIVLPAPPPAPPEIVIPSAPAPTPPVPQWALMVIIIIGAVLVIALIVLIMRTRRPV